jgi:hypothetical protein
MTRVTFTIEKDEGERTREAYLVVLYFDTYKMEIKFNGYSEEDMEDAKEKIMDGYSIISEKSPAIQRSDGRLGDRHHRTVVVNTKNAVYFTIDKTNYDMTPEERREHGQEFKKKRLEKEGKL